MAKRRTIGRRSRRRMPFNQRLMAVLIFIVVGFIVWLNYQDTAVTVPQGEIWVHFIDVGQGDSILVQSADNAVLIDAGPTAAGQVIINYLVGLGIETLDYVVATHPHLDHIGGMPMVLDRFEVREMWMPDVAHDTDAFERLLDTIERNNLEITTIQAGANLSAGIIQMNAVAPVRSGYGNLNDYSIVLRMQHGQTSFLFTGDAETISENEMVASGVNLRSTVLNAGHHGSRTSSTDAFLDAVDPYFAVISAGADNQFNHPHPEVLERFYQRGIDVFRTDEMGTIVFFTDGVDIYFY